jgi:peptidoglycan/LPS O-acetylase OafA/YrhL
MKASFDQRQNNIDFVRIVLALLVIFSHSFPLTLGHERTEPFNVLSRGQVTGGHIAVDLFFILSGFLIAASYERSRSALSFLRKRVARIYTAFILMALITAFVIIPLSHGRVDGTTFLDKAVNVVSNTLRLSQFSCSGVFPSNPAPDVINGSLWSIPYEFWCYIGVLILGLTGMLRSKTFLVVTFGASIVVSLLFAYFKWHISGGILGRIWGYPPFWARLLPMYMAGVVFYRFRNSLPLSRLYVLIAAAALAIACVVPLGYTALFPIAGTYLIMCFSFSPVIRLHQTNRFGDFSYGTYLYAFPMQQLILSWIGHPTSPLLLFAYAAPLTLLIAIMSWYTVERRFLQATHKKAEVKPLVLELS